MELIKERIQIEQREKRIQEQIVLQEDINITDKNPDAEKILLSKGDVYVTGIDVNEDEIVIQGNLSYEILYQSAYQNILVVPVKGQLSFREKFICENCEKDKTGITVTIEDLRVELIHSRKYSVMAVLSAVLSPGKQIVKEACVDVSQEALAEYRKKSYRMTELLYHGKDLYRSKEEVTLPARYPNILRLLWADVSYEHLEFQALEGKITVEGEKRAFFLYQSEDDDSIQCYEYSTPFSGTIEIPVCRAQCIADVRVCGNDDRAEAVTDYDGEMRMFVLESVMNLEIDLYDEKELLLFSDLYGVREELTLETTQIAAQNLLRRSYTDIRMEEELTIPSAEATVCTVLYQHAEVTVQDFSVDLKERQVLLRGLLTLQLLYLEDDKICGYRHTIPVTDKISIPELTNDSDCEIHIRVDRLSARFAEGRLLQVKAVIGFTCTVFEKIDMTIITDVKAEPISSEVKSQLPAMAIYYVKKGETLWDIGKRYFVQVEQIKRINGLTKDELYKGQKLFIVRTL